MNIKIKNAIGEEISRDYALDGIYKKSDFAKTFSLLKFNDDGKIRSIFLYPTLDLAEKAAGMTQSMWIENDITGFYHEIWVGSVWYNGSDETNALTKY